MKNNEQKAILALIDKAARAGDSQDAMRFSQAACNAANALCSLESINKL